MCLVACLPVRRRSTAPWPANVSPGFGRTGSTGADARSPSRRASLIVQLDIEAALEGDAAGHIDPDKALPPALTGQFLLPALD